MSSGCSEGEGRAWSLYSIVIDSGDVEASVRFWSLLLGLSVSHRFEEYVMLGDVVGGTRLTIQAVDRVSSEKNSVHFDIEPDDFSDFVARALALGGSKVEDVRSDQYSLTVLADPCGVQFCVNERTSVRVRNGTDKRSAFDERR